MPRIFRSYPNCLFICLVALTANAIAQDANLDHLRLNQIQVIGTHNSYHIAQPKAVLDEIAKQNKQLAESLDYTHRPLREQFSNSIFSWIKQAGFTQTQSS
jgi:hypothetical protein